MDELLEALNHIDFHTMDVEEIFQGRKRNDFDNERIRAFIEVGVPTVEKLMLVFCIVMTLSEEHGYAFGR